MKNKAPIGLTWILLCLLSGQIQASVPVVVCDTLTTVEGKVYLVANVEIQWQEIHFTTCDDPARVFTIPKSRVASIKKAVMPKVYLPQLTAPKRIAPPKRELNPSTAPPVDSAAWMASEALELGITALVLSATIILSPIGLILGVFAIEKASQGLHFIGDHPKRRKLKRKLRMARILGRLALLPIIVFIFMWVAFTRSRDFPAWDWGFANGWWTPN